jgi:hypothetical protein
MAVRLPGLPPLLHVRKHIEVGFRIVIEHAPAGRRGFAEGLGDEGRIGQELPEPFKICASAVACGPALSSARLSAQNSSSV